MDILLSEESPFLTALAFLVKFNQLIKPKNCFIWSWADNGKGKSWRKKGAVFWVYWL